MLNLVKLNKVQYWQQLRCRVHEQENCAVVLSPTVMLFSWNSWSVLFPEGKSAKSITEITVLSVALGFITTLRNIPTTVPFYLLIGYGRARHLFRHEKTILSQVTAVISLFHHYSSKYLSWHKSTESSPCKSSKLNNPLLKLRNSSAK